MEKTLSEKIRETRKEKGLSQKMLANYLRISDRAVSKWETGLSKPSVENLFRISGILGVPVDFFSDTSGAVLPYAEKTAKGMESIRELYKVGRGPSSSHTIAPEKACKLFKAEHKDADRFCVVLYGSLAKTGKGHGTDVVIKKTFMPLECEVKFNFCDTDIPHPNTMEMTAFKENDEIGRKKVFSIGGGSILFEGEEKMFDTVYNHTKFSDIADCCRKEDIRIWEYAVKREDSDFLQYLNEIWKSMKKAIKRGLNDNGILPGGLSVQKRAKSLYSNEHIDETAETRENRMVCAYAFAVGEQNASGEPVVTAPTCGAAGVLPSVLYYQQQKNNFCDDEIVHALATAGIIGNLIKTNASISGAECGCQAEIGSACAMAAAGLAELFKLSIDKIEYAAEIAIEHHLGLTCDPICGLVQIPCIERNAVAAMRAINAVNLASFLWDSRKISFDRVVKTMKETGVDMCSAYKETSEAGLAKIKI